MSYLLLALASVAGGAANALAGGGMFLVFPALLLAGVPPILSNATATFLLTPGGFASTWVYRDRLIHGWGIQTAMVVTAILGSLLGSELLLHTSENTFQRAAPYLMLGATLIFTLAGKLRTAAHSHAAKDTHRGPLLAGQFLIAVYGGYFGAGMGVLMLVLYTLAARMDVHQASGLRILCGVSTNTAAIVLFAVRGIIVWRLGLPMMLACFAGGYWGAKAVKRLNPERARLTILIYAWAVTAWLFIRGYFNS